MNSKRPAQRTLLTTIDICKTFDAIPYTTKIPKCTTDLVGHESLKVGPAKSTFSLPTNCTKDHQHTSQVTLDNTAISQKHHKNHWSHQRHITKFQGPHTRHHQNISCGLGD